LGFAEQAEVDEFAATLDRFERGEITPEQWRTFRLTRGTYGQRQDDASHMVRVKIPQGILTAPQARAIADVAERYSRGFAHITTRENVQLHFVPLADVPAAMQRLADDGLTTREACGNSVRNVTSCPYAGVAADEAFDVTPFAEVLTRYFLRHPLSGVLPRKFKVAFEGCSTDHAKAAINDIGWFARRVDGRNGFRVVVGGGTATLPRSGAVLFDFLPAGEILDVAEAIVQVFHAHGDYQHRHRNRMKFLIRSMGWEHWRHVFERALTEVRASGPRPLGFDPDHPPVQPTPAGSRPPAPPLAWIESLVRKDELRGPGIRPLLAVTNDSEARFERWKTTNVRPQKQPGYVVAVVTAPLGDLTAGQWQVVADLSDAFADGEVRLTPGQDLYLRWVRSRDLRQLYRSLAAAGLGLAEAETTADVTSCPGAESCKLAVTQSRGLGQLLESHLRANPTVIPLTPTLDVKISGCPNGCGQHHIAAIGFQGSLRKVDGRAVPQYFVLAGGGVSPTGATFGRLVAKVPARRAAEALDRLSKLFADERLPNETAAAFFHRVDVRRLTALLDDLEGLTTQTAEPQDFIDLAETSAFRPETMDGECAV
jgi:sulfite reductase (NADPH) hemoprotein beta-component